MDFGLSPILRLLRMDPLAFRPIRRQRNLEAGKSGLRELADCLLSASDRHLD